MSTRLRAVWDNVSKSTLIRGAHVLYVHTIAPKSASEDSRRREFILNVIVAGTIVLLFVMGVGVLHDTLTQGLGYQGIPLPGFLAIFLLFIGLYTLSRRGYFILASYIFISLYFAVEVYAAVSWGPDLPGALLGFSLLVVIASVLISTRFSFFTVLVSAAVLTTLGYREGAGTFLPKSEWKFEPLHFNDTISFSTLLVIIAVVSWLSNREVERSLHRARRSEAELREERNLLEVKVEERTRELRQAQLERMGQLARFAEVGRLAAGMIHDLLSPLTAIALNVEELEQKNAEVAGTRGNLDAAIKSARRMDDLISAIRKRMSQQELQVAFSLNQEIDQVLSLFDYKAKKAGVALRFTREHDVQIFGDPIKFNQIVSNLVSNAIDAYDHVPPESVRREVVISLARHRDIVRLEVMDRGAGIPQEYLSKIFDPFFTTKEVNKGTGLGLATVKHIVEQVFGGKIEVKSAVGEGATFTVEFAA
jgi:signal transduction histidine kinase